MKARELKDLRANNPQDLVAKLGELKAELFNLRFQLAMRIREVKKSIAQIKTIIREEEIRAFEQ